MSEGGSGGDAGEGGGDGGGEAGDVVEGEDAVVESEGEELALVMREGVEGGGGGVEEGAEDAGGGGFAARRRAGEDEDGIGAGGAQGGEEPGKHAAIGRAGEVKERLQVVEGRGGMALGAREGAGVGRERGIASHRGSERARFRGRFRRPRGRDWRDR